MLRMGRASGFPIAAVLLSLAPPSSLQAAAGAQSGLCDARQLVYFSCATSSHKSINVCHEPRQAVEYRFGRGSKVELRYPRDSSSPPLRFAQYSRFQTAQTEVTFSTGGASYAVFDRTENGRRSAGVEVTLASGKALTIACKAAIKSRLDELKSVLPCDTDNALNLDACADDE